MPSAATHKLPQNLEPRYLCTRFDLAGVGHNLALLRKLLLLAHRLNRIAVIPTFRLSPHHNARASADGNPLLYANLDQSTVRENGKSYPVRYVLETDFDENQFTSNQVKRLVDDQEADLTPEDNARYTLISLNMWCSFLTATQTERDISVSLAPSGAVQKMTQHVIQGMLRASGKSPRPLSESPLYFDYCCVKVRRTDKIYGAKARMQSGRIALTTVGNIKANLLQRGFVHPNTTIYLMSDEADLRYFDDLRKCYANYFTARDFTSLNALRAPLPTEREKKAFNMHLLCAIEYEIYRQARIRFMWDQSKWMEPDHILASRHRFRYLNAAYARGTLADQGQQTIVLEHASVGRFLLYWALISIKTLLQRSEFLRRLLGKLIRKARRNRR